MIKSTLWYLMAAATSMPSISSAFSQMRPSAFPLHRVAALGPRLCSSTALPSMGRAMGYSTNQARALYMSNVATNTNLGLGQSRNSNVPITLLSGFLGAGKTSTLKHLLENTEGVRIGVVVNDVAECNIDAKLLSGVNENGVVELQNGCACCSLADELLTSVDTLLEGRHQNLDAVVVELSGVADPMAIRANWKQAKSLDHPVTQKSDIAQVVTLVDACTFGTNWMTSETAGDRESWVDPTDDCAASRMIAELLAEQVEAADIILVNKVDLAGPDQVAVATSLAKSMNDKAFVREVKYGKVAPSHILGNVLLQGDTSGDTGSGESCHEPTRDAQSNHAHVVGQDSEAPATCGTEATERHSQDESCSDPHCTDPSHSHHHHHGATTTTDDLGIVNFVYKADRPFNLKKLLPLLSKWPVPIKKDLDFDLLKEAQEEGYRVEGKEVQAASPFLSVLRSKGFCWFAPTKWSGPDSDVWRHDTAMYWSHAGKHFGISAAGTWWGSITKEQMAQHFQNDSAELDRILKEDFATDEFGDRRQEIVFIGAGLQEEEIRTVLDECLLDDYGMDRYREELGKVMEAF